MSRLRLFNVLKGLSPEEVKLLAVLGSGSFLLMSSLSSINVALPQIQQDFDISLSALKWVSMIGAIMVGSLSLCFGRIGDIKGRKRVYRTGMLVYAIGAGLSATALSFPHLMVFRVMMATGLAMSQPLAAAIIAASAAPERRGQLLGLFASCAAAGQLMGPTLGGFILEVASWRAILLTNMSLGLVLCVAQHFLLRGIDERRDAVFDLMGAILLLVGYPALLIALSFGPSAGWDSPLVLSWLLVAFLGLAGFALRETRFHTPLFQLRFFRSLPFVVAIFTLMVAQFVQNPITIFAPLYLDRVQGLDALSIGLMMMALPVATVIAGPIGGRLADLHPPRLVAAAGALVTLVAVVLYAQLGLNTAVLWVLAPLLLIGFGVGLFRPANQVTIYRTARPSDYGSISAMLTSVGGLAGTMGTTITVALTETRLRGGDAASFASAQSHTFMMLAPLLLLAVAASLIHRKKDDAALVKSADDEALVEALETDATTGTTTAP
jgi:EmrB/QacA subfamily drug resistance transporter